MDEVGSGRALGLLGWNKPLIVPTTRISHATTSVARIARSIVVPIGFIIVVS